MKAAMSCSSFMHGQPISPLIKILKFNVCKFLIIIGSSSVMGVLGRALNNVKYL